MKIFIALAISLFLLISCQNNEVTNSKSENNKAEISISVKDFITNWNTAHNEKDIDKLITLYDDSVEYYGSEVDKNTITKDKKVLFKKYPGFNQKLVDSSLKVEQTSNGLLISFDKAVEINKTTTTYPSYLLLERDGKSYSIQRESDGVTDANLLSIREPKKTSKEITVKGDFNGDGEIETATVTYPDKIQMDNIDEEGINYGGYECVGGCNTVIYFSNKNIYPITIMNTTSVNLENIGDLNSDGSDNLIVVTISSRYDTFYVYNVKERTIILPPQSIKVSIHENLGVNDVFQKMDDFTVKTTRTGTNFDSELMYYLEKEIIDLNKVDLSEYNKKGNFIYNF